MNMWEIEDSCYADGVKMICGVDEAGRGPLAGPVCAAAVILPPHLEIPGLTDSKKLTDKKRRELFPIIKDQPLVESHFIGFWFISPICFCKNLKVQYFFSLIQVE